MATQAKLKFYNGKFIDPSQASCLLTISVGQLSHENDKLRSTLKSVNNSFNKCHIFICDTLQRYNIELIENLPPEKSRLLALLNGDRWINRNKYLFKELTIQNTYSRWDDWLQHENFYGYYKIMLDHYDNDIVFKKHMEQTINEFYIRRKKSFFNVTFEKLYQSCLKYLLEECTVQKIISSFNFDYELYPSKRNAILSYCHEKFIFSEFSPKLIPVSLKFVSRKIAA